MTHDIAKTHGPLEEALRVQRMAAARGFDWREIGGVLKKVREELGEIEAALKENDLEHAREELGDLFFSAINLSRFLDRDPAEAIYGSAERFARRLSQMEIVLQGQGRGWEECTLEELDVVWERVKAVP